MPAKPVITLEKVSKRFSADGGAKSLALKDINLKIGAGEFFVFLGPSGCGKSTLLRIMSGLEKADGEVTVNPDYIGHMAFVFQQFALLPWLTVYENVELPLLGKGLSRNQVAQKVNHELLQLGLQKFANAHPGSLSGGMRQRVGMARALAIDPKIMFLDEPFSELDSYTAQELRLDLLKIWEERKMTVVMVTHIVPEAIELADRIAVMTPRPGHIEKILVNKLARPRHKRSPDFYVMEDKLDNLIKP